MQSVNVKYFCLWCLDKISLIIFSQFKNKTKTFFTNGYQKVFLACSNYAHKEQTFQLGNPYRRERVSTVDLLVLPSLDPLIFIIKLFLLFYKKSYLNEEVNRTDHSPYVSLPCYSLSFLKSISEKEKYFNNRNEIKFVFKMFFENVFHQNFWQEVTML